MSLRLAFDGFGRDCLTEEAESTGRSVGELLRAASRYYLSEVGTGRPGVPVPPFSRFRLDGAALEVELELDDRELAAAVTEAERQGLKVERLLEHAALFYIADLDAGRVPGADARTPI